MLLILSCAGPALAQIASADDLCNPASDPCVVSSAVTLESNAFLVLENRTLLITTTGRLTARGGNLTIVCRRFQMDGSSQINLSASGDDEGGSLNLSASETVTIAGTVNVSSAGGGGSITVTAKEFQLTPSGRLLLNGGVEWDGGSFDLNAERVVIGGQVQLNGGSQSAGGAATVYAESFFSVSGLLSATGGESDAGSVSIQSGRVSIVGSGAIRVDASNGGWGGSLTIVAVGDSLSGGAQADLIMEGTLSAVGGSSTDGGGDGGEIEVTADGGCVLAGTIQAQSGSDGSGGTITIACSNGASGDLASGSNIDARGPGRSGSGGGVSLVASGGSVAITRNIDVGGGIDGSGGSVVVEASGDVIVSGRVTANGDFGEVSLIASGSDTSRVDLTQVGSIRADATGTPSFGGAVNIEACRTQVLSRGGSHQSITALGTGGAIILIGVIQIEIAGRLTAGPAMGAISLIYRDVLPSIEATASFAPGPVLALDTSLSGCDAGVPTSTPTATSTVVSATSAVPSFTPTPTPADTGTETPNGPTSTPTPTPTATARPTAAGSGDTNCDGVLESDETRGVIISIFDETFVDICPNAPSEATVVDLLAYVQALAASE